MFLHLGADVVVFLKDIIAVMDIEKTTTTQISREFLRRSQEKGSVITVSDDLPKSFIVAVKDGQQTVYLSPISTATLNKRILKEPQINRRNTNVSK